MDYWSLIDNVKKIAKGAGVKIIDIYNSDFSNSIQLKIDKSPVTKADTAANDFIVKELKRLTPEIPIISEEDEMESYDIRKNYEYCWIVDPLDGTKEFIKRNGEFTVNIALIKDSISILGVVYIPVTDEMFWGAKSYGSYSYLSGEIIKLQTRKIQENDVNFEVLLSRSHLDLKTKERILKYNKSSIKFVGSSIKFLKIAKGESDLYFRYSPTMEWDTAASQIILEEAGGTLKDINTDVRLNYNKYSLLNPGFIAHA